MLFDSTGVGSGLLFLGTFFLTLIVTVLPHELGHALVGWGVGMRVFTVTIGSTGRVLCVRQVLGHDFVLHHVLFGGSTLYAPRGLRFVRARHFAAVLGGPLANVLLAAGEVGLYQAVRGEGRLTCVLSGFIFGNIAQLGFALFPRKFWIESKHVPNDGLLLLTIPFMSRKSVEAWRSTRFYYETTEALQRDNIQAAERWLAKGEEAYPAHSSALVARAGIFEHRRQYAEARDLYASALNHPEATPEFRAHLWNNIAWLDLMIGDPALLAEADRFSQQALEEAPWLPYVRGTRGGVLIELCQIDNGMRLVQQAFRENYFPTLKALNACYLAIANARQGNLSRARQHVAEAGSGDPTCPLLERTIRELERSASQARTSG